jgi:uncharacterized membrane protein YkvA (DUF1232 family)
MARMKRRPASQQPGPGPAATKRASKATCAEPLLQPSDIRRIVLDAATRIAPADVVAVMAREQQLRAWAKRLKPPTLTLLSAQLNLALDCLKDHVAGNSPQIPYFTISLLAAGVCYFGDVLDVVPDFLPNIGKLDDAAVMAMACQLAADGLRRYCTWKGRSADAVLGNARG